MDNDQSPMQNFRSFYEEMILLLDALSASNNQQESETTLTQMALVMEELERWERSSEIMPKQRELGSLLMRQLDEKVDRILDETGPHNEWGQRVHLILRRASDSIKGITVTQWIDDEITSEDSTHSSGRPKSTDDSDDANQVVHQLSVLNEKHDIEISEMEQESMSNYEEKDGDNTASDDHHANVPNTEPLIKTSLVRQLTDLLKRLSANATDLQRNQLGRQKEIQETVQEISNTKDEEIQKLKDTLEEKDTEILTLESLVDGSREQKWKSLHMNTTARLTLSNNQLKRVKKTLSQRDEELKAVKQELQELTKSVSVSNRFDAMDSDVRVNELELELRKLNETYNERRELLTKTTKELEVARNDLMKQKEEMSDLETKLLNETMDYHKIIGEKETELKSARNEIMAQKEELQRVKAALSQTEEDFETLRGKVHEYETEMETLDSDGESQRVSDAAVFLDLMEARSSRQSLMVQVEDAMEEITELWETIDEKDKQIKSTRKQAEDQRAVIRKVHSEMFVLRETLVAAKKESIADAEREIAGLQMTVQELAHRVKEGERQRVDADAELKRKEEEAMRKEKELSQLIAKLREKLDGLMDDVAGKDKELKDSVKHHDAVSERQKSEIKRLNVALDTEKEERKGLEDGIKQRDSELLNVRQDLDVQNKLNRVLQQQMTEAKKEINGLQKEMDRLRAKLSQNKAEKLELGKIATEQLVSLQRKEDEYRQQIGSLQQQIENQNKAMSAMSKALEHHKALAAQQTNGSIPSPNETRVSLRNLVDAMDNEKMNKKAAAKVKELEHDLKKLNSAHKKRKKLLFKTTNELKFASNDAKKQKKEVSILEAKLTKEKVEHRIIIGAKQTEINRLKKALRAKGHKPHSLERIAEANSEVMASKVDEQLGKLVARLREKDRIIEGLRTELDENTENIDSGDTTNAMRKMSKEIESLKEALRGEGAADNPLSESLTLRFDGDIGDTAAFLESEGVTMKMFGAEAVRWALGEQFREIEVKVNNVRSGSVLVACTLMVDEKVSASILGDAVRKVKQQIGSIFSEPWTGNDTLNWMLMSLEVLNEVPGKKPTETSAELSSVRDELQRVKATLHQREEDLEALKQKMIESESEVDVDSVSQRVSGIAMFFDSMEADSARQSLMLQVEDAMKEITELKETIDKKDKQIESTTNQVEDQRAVIRKVHSEMYVLKETLIAAKRESMRKEKGAQIEIETKKVSKAKIGKLIAERNVLRRRLRKSEGAETEIARLKSQLNLAKVSHSESMKEVMDRMKSGERELMELKVRERGLAPLIGVLREEMDRLIGRFESDGDAEEAVDELSTPRVSSLSWAQRMGMKRQSWVAPKGRAQSGLKSLKAVREEQGDAQNNGAKIKKVTVDVVGVEQQIDALMAMINVKDEGLRQLNEALQLKEENVEALTQRVSIRDNEFEDYRHSLQAIIGKVELVGNDNDRMIAMEKEGEIRALTIRIADAEREIAGLQRVIEAKDADILERDNGIEDQNDIIRELDEEMVNLKEALRALRVHAQGLAHRVKEGGRQRVDANAELKRKEEEAMRREKELSQLIAKLREELDGLMDVVADKDEEQETPSKLSWAQRAGAERESWIPPKQRNLLKNRPLIPSSVPEQHRTPFEQRADIQWITGDLRDLQHLIVGQQDAPKRILDRIKEKLSQREEELETPKQKVQESEKRLSVLSNLFEVMDSDKMNKKAAVKVNELELELKRLNEAFNERTKLLTKTTKGLRAARNALMKQNQVMTDVETKLFDSMEKEEESQVLQLRIDDAERVIADLRRVIESKDMDIDSSSNRIEDQRTVIRIVHSEMFVLRDTLIAAKRESMGKEEGARNKVEMEKESKAKIGKLVAERNALTRRLRKSEGAEREIARLKSQINLAKVSHCESMKEVMDRMKSGERELMELKVRERGLAPLIGVLREEMDRLIGRFESDGDGEEVVDELLTPRVSSLSWAQRLGMKRESWVAPKGRAQSGSKSVKPLKTVIEEQDDAQKNGAEIKRVTVDVVGIQQQIDALMAMIDAKDDELFRLNEESKLEVEALTQRVSIRDNEFEDYRHSLQAIIGNVEVVGNDNDKMIAMAKEGEIRALTIRIADAEREIAGLQRVIEAKDADILERDNGIEDQNDIIRELDEEMVNLKEALRALRVQAQGLAHTVKEEERQRVDANSELKRIEEEAMRKERELSQLIAKLRGQLDELMDVVAEKGTEQETPSELTWAQRVGGKRQSWISPEQRNRVKNRPLIPTLVPAQHFTFFQQGADIQWVIGDLRDLHQWIVGFQNQKTEMNRAADDVRDDQMMSMFIEKEKTNELERAELRLNEKERELNEYSDVMTIGINRLRVETDQLLLALSEHVDSGACVSKAKEEVAERGNTTDDHSVVIEAIADDLVSIRGEIVTAFSLADMATEINAKQMNLLSIANHRERNCEEASSQNSRAYGILSILILSIIALIQNTDYWTTVERDDEYSYYKFSSCSEGGQMDENNDNELRSKLEEYVHLNEQLEMEVEGHQMEAMKFKQSLEDKESIIKQMIHDHKGTLEEDEEYHTILEHQLRSALLNVEAKEAKINHQAELIMEMKAEIKMQRNSRESDEEYLHGISMEFGCSDCSDVNSWTNLFTNVSVGLVCAILSRRGFRNVR